jgi:hypothetical protein
MRRLADVAADARRVCAAEATANAQLVRGL